MIRFLLAKIFHKHPILRTAFLVIGDFVSIIIAVLIAFLLRFDGIIPDQYTHGALWGVILLIAAFLIPSFALFRLYSFSWSYVSTPDLLSLMKAVIIGFLCAGISFFLFRDTALFAGFPRSVLLMSAVLIFFFSGGIRFAKRIIGEIISARSRGHGARTLIVGAGDAGARLARNIITSSAYHLVGFIDDNAMKHGTTIHGIRVLGPIEHIPAFVSAYHIEEMIIALPSVGSGVVKKAVEYGRKAGLSNIKVVPPLAEIINGEVSVRAIREIQVEDLLGRDVVSLDLAPIGRFIQGKRVLITGAAGSIGFELSRQISRFNPALVVLLDQDETGTFYIEKELCIHFPGLPLHAVIADIRDQERIDVIFSTFRPDIVFHAAAYKHVPLMEVNLDEAVKNNVFGTLVLGEAALEHGVQAFVFISTDKAVNPTSVMGATKRIGEMICQTLNQKNGTKFISVRFGNVLASRGSVIPIFREQIKKGGPVTVTHPDMKRYFMSISEACLLVLQAGSIGTGGEVFVLDMGEPVKILDLAHEIIRLSGFEPDKDIPIVFTGMRPGEKLFEELLSAEDGTLPTQHAKIFRAKLRSVEGAFLDQLLAKLRKAVQNRSQAGFHAIFKEAVPSYNSRNDMKESMGVVPGWERDSNTG